MLPLIPVIIGALAAGGLYKKYKSKQTAMAAPQPAALHGERNGILTPDRQVVYEVAMNEVSDPAKLNGAAAVFAGEGLKDQADMLRKKARLRALPPEIKAQRKEVWRKALQSKDKAALLQFADALHGEGCWGAEEHIRNIANGVK